MGAAGLAIAGLSLQGGTSLLQYSATKTAGKIQRYEAEVEAEQEELGATQREADRKTRLAEALASQNAAAAAGGIASFEGSPLTIMEADIEKEKTATERDKFMTNLKAESLRMRGQTAEKMARAGATLSLLGSAGQIGVQGAMAFRG